MWSTGIMFRKISILAVIALVCAMASARAQTEFPPPSGKGPVVVMVSGQSGAAHYQPKAEQVAALGYDVVLIDGNDMEGTHGAALMTVVMAAQNEPHGTPGKVAVVGFSLGGGEALAYATRWPDLVTGIVVWYPLTRTIRDPVTFVTGIKVPVLMFAGGEDTYKNCCLIEQAQAIASAASQQNIPLTLVTYPEAGHEFNLPGDHYDSAADADSWQKATARLAQYFGH